MFLNNKKLYYALEFNYLKFTLAIYNQDYLKKLANID